MQVELDIFPEDPRGTVSSPRLNGWALEPLWYMLVVFFHLLDVIFCIVMLVDLTPNQCTSMAWLYVEIGTSSIVILVYVIFLAAIYRNNASIWAILNRCTIIVGGVIVAACSMSAYMLPLCELPLAYSIYDLLIFQAILTGLSVLLIGMTMIYTRCS